MGSGEICMGVKMTADQFNTIKAKVKAEMNRRCLAGLDQTTTPIDFGSLRQFGSDNYDFPVVPAKGEPILAEQGEKVINLLYEIEDQQDVPFVATGVPLPESVDTLESYVDALKLESIEGNSSSCRGACSGLCFGSCINGCNGCSGQCNTGCQGCTATCGTGCAGSSMA